MAENKTPLTNINISTISIIKVLIILLVVGFLYLIRDILAMIFVAIIFASVIDPLADWFQQKKIPRGLSVILIYLLLFAVFGSVIILLVPPVAEQINQLSANFSSLWDRVVSGLFKVKEYSEQAGFLNDIQKSLQAVQAGLGRAAGGVFNTISGIFGGLVSFIVVLVITFYIVVEDSAIKKLFRSLAPAEYQPYISQIFFKIQKKIGLWVKGQLMLCLIIFIFSFVGLLILGVNYALVLALIAGLMEFVPYVGPILAAIPAIFLAFTQSPFKALLVLILYFVIQQLENNVIVPKVMQRAVGLNPIVSIISILIGFKVAGVIGALLAIPVATALGVFLEHLFSQSDSQSLKK